MTEYGYDISNMTAWEDAEMTIPVDTSKWTREEWEKIIGGIPIVRCKDCKYYAIYELKADGTDDKRYKPSVCIKGEHAKRRDPDWFCADGERREE